MKIFIAFLASILGGLTHKTARQHSHVLTRLLLIILFLIIFFAVCFHFLMIYEGRSYSWITAFYWTLTVMSTLGFGDITFFSDAGRFLSIIVLLSGIVLLLIILPFSVTQHFYIPWLERQKKEMVPHRLPPETKGHIIFIGFHPLALSVVDDLNRYGLHTVILCNDTHKALELAEQGYQVVRGEYDKVETYRALQADTAAMLVVLVPDIRSANVVFSAHEAAPKLPITASAERAEGKDMLLIAGCTHCFYFYYLLGAALCRRVIKPNNRMSVLGRFGQIIVAEAPVMRSHLVGQTLLQSRIRDKTGVNVVGLWERGRFSLPTLTTVFSQSTVLVVAGTEQQIKTFGHSLVESDSKDKKFNPVIILGGGRVGLETARSLERRNIACVIVDKKEHINAGDTPHIRGDASELQVLEKAGIRQTPAIIITTHDDDANIYLTIYCRGLRPDVQIICRASLERNINGLHMAGADLVLSFSSLISYTIIKLLTPDRVIMLSERLLVFRYTVQANLAGKKLKESGIRNKTGCSVIAIHNKDGTAHVNPDANYTFFLEDKIYLIGDIIAQERFRLCYGIDKDFSRNEAQTNEKNNELIFFNLD